MLNDVQKRMLSEWFLLNHNLHLGPHDYNKLSEILQFVQLNDLAPGDTFRLAALSPVLKKSDRKCRNTQGAYTMFGQHVWVEKTKVVHVEKRLAITTG